MDLQRSRSCGMLKDLPTKLLLITSGLLHCPYARLTLVSKLQRITRTLDELEGTRARSADLFNCCVKHAELIQLNMSYYETSIYHLSSIVIRSELSPKALVCANRYSYKIKCKRKAENEPRMSIVRTFADRRDSLCAPRKGQNAHIPDPFIEFQLFERTILYFPSSPITPLYEKQAASGRAPAGMSGIFGWRVASGKTVVRSRFPRRNAESIRSSPIENYLASRRPTILLVKNRNSARSILVAWEIASIVRSRIARTSENGQYFVDSVHATVEIPIYG